MADLGGTTVNGLRGQAADYLRVRRSLGFKLIEHERFLAQFLDYLDRTGAATITVDHAVAWARLPADASPPWHAARLNAVRGFAAWAHTFDPDVQVPPRGLLPLRTGRATPYLYSADQVRALLDTAATLVPAWWATTFQTLIGLLAVTGMRAGEAIRADVGDLDLLEGALTIRGTKYGKSRLLPLHPSVTDVLHGYLRLAGGRASATPALLVSAAGTRLTYGHVQRTYKKLTARADVLPRSAACRPRLHDLRHTFAVNTLLDAYRAGDDPAARLPLLSTYLGHADPANTYWYLHACPELLALAADRLNPHGATR